jgi:transcriptional regulator with XRE-family HTH domain
MMKFHERLKAVMTELHLTQTQVVGMTGCSKASISQYLSGKNTPSADKQRDIATALGLNADYFEQSDDMQMPRLVGSGKEIQTMIPADAAKLMHLDVATVRRGLQQGVFPWGYGIHMASGKWVYFINARRFAEIEGVAV